MKKVCPEIVRQIQGNEETEKVLSEAVRNGDDVRGIHFADAAIQIRPVRILEFYDCRFENCQFEKSGAEKLVFVDVQLNNCDLSNFRLDHSVFQRVEIDGCRAIGLSMTQLNANNVWIHDSICRYINVNASDWQHVTVENTDCSSACMEDCRFKAVAFLRCSLMQADVLHTLLNGMDLTTDEIEGISASGAELRGVVITPGQACELARLLGVVIRYETE